MYKEVILSKILEYFKYKKLPYRKSGKVLMVKCPICNTEPLSAQRIPNTYYINCFKCQIKYTLLDYVKFIEPEYKDKNDEEIIQHIKEVLDIKIETKKDEEDLDKILSFYEENEFDLVPVAHNDKRPIELAWNTKNHKDKVEWKSWLVNGGLNLGLKTGKISKVIAIDVDTKEVNPELLKLLTIVKTLKQTTLKGFHYIFKYTFELPKTRIEELKVDIETDGGQVVIFPSVVDGHKRAIELNPITEMPKELLDFLKSKVTVPRKTNSERLKEEIKQENFKLDYNKLQLKNNNLEGCCNTEFLKLGGVLRKRFNPNQTEEILQTLNQCLLENPMDKKSVTAMSRSLEHYVEFDQQEMAHEIVEHLKEVESITKSDLELAINGGFTKGEAKKRFNKTLQYLIKEEKIILRGKKIELVQDLDWSKDLIQIGVPINFKVPYFNDYAYFNWQDMIVIGAKSGWGKGHIAMNIIKRLVDQGVHPYYIYTETGGRFAKIALKLGLTPDQFEHAFLGDPRKFRLPKDIKRPVIIYDWFRPVDFAKTDELMERLLEKVKKVDGFLILFMQLKRDDSYFAPNLIDQFPAFACKYLYEDDEKGEYTKFDITKIREAKMKGRNYSIPCKYNWTTKQVYLISELKDEEKE